MSDHLDEIETVIHEVFINGEWVEWSRTDRQPGYVWDGAMISALKPQTRIRFERRQSGASQ
jgi:hypothetical protein